jgi:hypothetical protein
MYKTLELPFHSFYCDAPEICDHAFLYFTTMPSVHEKVLDAPFMYFYKW